MQSLIPSPEIRAMCAEDKCHNYGRSWSCPPSPACGDITLVQEKIRRFDCGILIQTTGAMSDPYDMEAIRRTEDRQKQKFDTLVRQVRMILRREGRGQGCMPMSSGGCRRCFQCTYPDKPCRHPDLLYPSMEAYGLWVSRVCEASGVCYNYGENTITFTGCLLLGEDNSPAYA